jgi:hypothetical protein
MPTLCRSVVSFSECFHTNWAFSSLNYGSGLDLDLDLDLELTIEGIIPVRGNGLRGALQVRLLCPGVPQFPHPRGI